MKYSLKGIDVNVEPIWAFRKCYECIAHLNILMGYEIRYKYTYIQPL